MSNSMKSVLFVCTANRYRSPLAAAVFQKLLKADGKAEKWRIGSAGTWTVTGLPVIPHAFQKAQELGLNLREHSSVEVSREILSEYGLIVVMEIGHKEGLQIEFPETRNRVYMLSEIIDHIVYDIPDPAKDLSDADEIAGDLYDLIQRGYSEICLLADEKSKA
ncbi:MAG: hypothetical protein HOG15_00350 [Anaerolineae bacterium]|jgi:protein-tyrosine phosphatase|nr:hypothetical protein [Anaerolineae bacterium]MBT6612604.1 hypothetical protein [Deltaproteobacteria bacterium]